MQRQTQSGWIAGGRQGQRVGVADDGGGAGDAAPRGDGRRVDLAGLAHGLGKAGGELGDQGLVARAQPPGAVAFGHRVAGAG